MASHSYWARSLLDSPNSKESHGVASALDSETLAAVELATTSEYDYSGLHELPYTGKSRRASGPCRQEHVSNGAFVFEPVPVSPDWLDLGASACEYTDQHRIVKGSRDWLALEQRYQTMCRKGYLVDKHSGCMIPHPQHGTKQGGQSIKGSSLVLQMFTGVHTNGRTADGRTKAKDPVTGFDSIPQNSALCHDHMCCNPAHRYIEYSSANRSRNYCLGGESCTHGPPKCCAAYKSGHEQRPADRELCTSEQEVGACQLESM